MKPIAFLRLLGVMLTLAVPAHADIYQWEYINPADPSQGKQQSTTLAPDGAAVDAAPGADLSHLDLTKAYLVGAPLSKANLTGTNLYMAHLTAADFSKANLSNGDFVSAMLTGADFTGAGISGANFEF